MALMIGRAWVKVAPHTKGFREETIDQLKRELDGIEKELGKDGNRVAIKTEIDVDRKKSSANFRKFYDSLEAVDKTIRITLDFDSDLDKKLEGLSKKVDAAVGDAVAKPRIEPTVDTEKLNEGLDEAAEKARTELTDAFEGALDGDRVKEWSERFEKELRKVRSEIKKNLDGISDLGSSNSINSIGQQLLNNSKQVEQALRNEEMARRRLGKLMEAEKQDADAILAAERKVLEATEQRAAAEELAEKVRDRLAKARIDALKKEQDAAADAASARMRAVEAEFNKIMQETDRLSEQAVDSARKAQYSMEDVGNAAFWAQSAIHEMFEADQEWMREAERGAYALRERGQYWTEATENLKHNFREAVRAVKEFGRAVKNAGTRDLEMDLDLSTFEGNLARVRHGLQEIKDDFDDSEIEFHPLMDDSSYRIVWARLKWLTRDRFAVIHPVVNKGAAALAERTLKAITLNATGLRNAGRALKNFFEYLERLDKNAPVLGMIATGIAAIGGAAVAAVGSVSHLAVELVRMAGAGLALPGILGGFAIGIGVFVTAIKNLNKEVPKVQQDLDAMGASINQKFWQNARVPLLEAWNKILPSLEKGFDKTASALGRWTAAMATGFADNLRPESMNYMFDNLAKSIDIASESADDLGRIMEILGKRGSEYLPRLAEWTNDLAAGFRNWLDEADRTGRLNEIIETGITKLKEFGVLVREAGELVYILGSAAERAGFSGLKEMSEGLEQVNEDLKANQDTLDDYFAGAANMSDGFKSAIGSIVSGLGEFSGTFETISTDVQSVFEDIGDAIEGLLGDANFQSGVEDLFGGIQSAVEDLTAVEPQLSAVLGSVASLAGTVVENIGDVGAKFIEAFGPEIVQILTGVKVPIDNLGDSLSNLVDALDGDEDGFSLLSALSGVLTDGLATTINNVADAVQGLADAIDSFNQVMDEGVSWDGLSGIFSGLGDALWAAVRDSPFALGFKLAELIVSPFEEQITQAGTELRAIWDNFLADLGALFGEGGALRPENLFDTVKTGIQDAWNTFWEWLTGLFSGEGHGGSGSSSQFSLTDSVADWLGLEDLSFDSLFEEAKSRLLEAWDGFWDWIGSLFGGGGESGGSGSGFDVEFNLTALDNASAIVTQVGENIRAWAAEKYEAILSAVNRTATAISNARTAIVNWAKTKYEAVLTALNRTATGISNARTAIVNWARRKYEAALTALNRTGTGISNAVSAIRSRVVNATFQAKVTMSSIVSGLSGVVSKIRNAVSNFTANVRTRFSSADGNVFPAVKAFANGGMERHVAQIARPSVPYRVWAEPETGGEAYIPLALAKRERSTAILADVADRFGYKLEKFANGSEPSSTRSVMGGNTYNLSVQTLRPDVASEVTSDVMFHLKHMAYGGGRQDGF